GDYRDDGAHGRMNIAEHPHDAGMPEYLALRRAGRVQPDIERLAAEIRKRTVEDRIEVGKIYRAAHRYREHVRREMTVALDHLDALGRRVHAAALYRLQPDDHARVVLRPAHRGIFRIGDLDGSANAANASGRHRRQPDGQARNDKPAPDHGGC